MTQPVGAADQGQGPHQVRGFTVTQTQARPPPSAPLPSREAWVSGFQWLASVPCGIPAPRLSWGHQARDG